VIEEELEQQTAPEVSGIGRRGRQAIIQLALRTGLVRVIQLVGTVILARILQPTDFGGFAVIAFLVGILAPLADLGLGAALVQQKEPPAESDIATVFTSQQIAWLVLLAIALLAAPLINLAGPGMPADAEQMVRVSAIGIWLGQLRAVPVAMMSRVLRFGPLAAIEVIQQLLYLVVSVGVALNGGGVWAFVWGLFAQFVAGAVLAYLAWGRLPGIGIDTSALRRLLGFGVAYQVASILSIVREALVPLFGGLAGGVAGIGYLNFGQRFGRLASSLDEIVGRVAFPTFSRLQGDRRRVSMAMLHSVESTALVLSLALGWAVAVGPTLFLVAFGENWLPAVPVFQLTALAALAAIPASFLRGLAFSVGRAREVLDWSAVAVVVTFVAFPFLLIAFGLVGGGLGFVLHSVIQLLGFARATRDIADFPWIRLGRIYAIGAVAGVFAAVSLDLISGVPGLFVSAGVFGAIYGALLLLFEREQVERSWQLVRGRTVLDAV
jgi:teichuronic acid exporter